MTKTIASGVMIAVVVVFLTAAAQAGAFRLQPGAAQRIDTGERGQYTTITISNPDATAGQLALDRPISRTIDIPAGGKVELYGQYGGAVAVTNTGASRLEIVTRYIETWRGP